MSAQSETFRLLQPGLMGIDELTYLLSQRGISVKSNSDKHQLVDMYERHLIPLSQRKFPKSHQGQLINKKILYEERKQKKDELTSRNDFQYGFKEKPSSSTSTQHISHQSSSTNSKDRLKPPIDSVSSPPSKKIFLSRRPSSDKDLDKIVINDRSKRHSESSSDGSGRENTCKAEKQDADKVSLKRSHFSNSKNNKERDEKELKPKRQRIGWP